MRLSTPAQMKEIERLTELEFSANSEILMECAGLMAARETQQAFFPELTRGKIAVICGPGNNGGDGLVVARHLYSQGYLALEVFTMGSAREQSPLFKLQLERAKKHGLLISDIEKDKEAMERIRGSKVIIDGLFGTGLSRALDGTAAEIVKLINASQNVVVSLDVPSGLSATTGRVLGQAVRAQMTVTFGLAKPGLIIGEGGEHTGRLRVVQIGFPRRLFREIAKTHFTFNERLARRWLPVRTSETNKARHGHLLVVAGQPGMWGAAALCCEAAYRLGSGYVTLALPSKKDAELFLGKEIGNEVLTTFRADTRVFEKKTAVVVGPGAGAGPELREFIERLIGERISHVVIDADGITALSEMKTPKLPKTWILTPHAGELARLIKATSSEIEEDRAYHAVLAAKKFGCLVLLKGYRTIIAGPDERVAIVVSGNPALAKAGTGDVLSGMIGALLAQGIGPVQAAGTAAYLHGRVADDWLRTGKDVRTFMPRDLIAGLPDLLGQLSREQ